MTARKLKSDVTVKWPKWKEIVNERFIPLVDDDSRYIIQYGGRGSGKSNFTAKLLLYKCLTEAHFRCVLIRNVADTIADSSYKEIQEAVEELGLQDLFTFKVKPREILCLNGNKFLCRGLDKPRSLKSLKEVTHAWFEEEWPNSLDDFVTIDTTIRSPKNDCLQLFFTINPEVAEASYQDNWFYDKFFGANPDEKSFKGKTLIDMGQGKTYEEKYTVHFSTYHDNRWIKDSFKAQMNDLKRTNPYKYTVYCLGEWGNKSRGGLFYKNFDRGRNTIESVKYDSNKPLHLSVDFNVVPFMSGVIFQFDDDGKKVFAIDEIATQSPHNNCEGLCREFERKYSGHHAGLFIYGDVSGKQRSTLVEQGWNGYRIIETQLKHFYPTLRIPNLNPALKTRADFINRIFLEGFKGISILIGEKCVHLINDLSNVQENADGGKLKERTRKNGETFEKFAHHSDAMDYFICEIFKKELQTYKDGDSPFKMKYGSEPFNTKHRF